jgi:hypothetical protein
MTTINRPIENNISNTNLYEIYGAEKAFEYIKLRQQVFTRDWLRRVSWAILASCSRAARTTNAGMNMILPEGMTSKL